MKTINVTFTDVEYRKLLKAKKEYTTKPVSWHLFILNKCSKGISEKRSGNKK